MRTRVAAPSAKRQFSAFTRSGKFMSASRQVNRPACPAKLIPGKRVPIHRARHIGAHAGARGAMEAMGLAVDDKEERVLSPADAEDLLLRVAAEQEVSALSMDAAFQPSPALPNLGPSPIGGKGPARHGGSHREQQLEQRIEHDLPSE